MFAKIKRFVKKHSWKLAVLVMLAETTSTPPVDLSKQLSSTMIDLLTTLLLMIIPVVAFVGIIRRVLDKV